jgi:polyisoprenyl-phosphate glycosyltransferase
MKAGLRVSVAIPVRNEESVLPELLRRTCAVLDAIAGGPHQVVFVDDGSSDRTLEILEDAARQDPRLLVVSLSRNFGHQAALTAALDSVSGDAVVLMDGDLQDVPETIPAFVDRFEEGYDVVYATRTSRREGWYLRLCYFLFYRLQALLSDIRVPVDAGDFGLISRRVVEQLRRMPERHRYLRGLRSWVGFRQVGVPVERAERHSGRSKYGMLKLLTLASDGIFAFSIVPLRAAALLGTVAIVFSLLYAAYAVIGRVFLSQTPRGFTTLALLTTAFSGTLLLFLGIIGEYVGRIYEEVKARPLYVVNKIIDQTSIRAIEQDPRVDEAEAANKVRDSQ